MTTNQPKHASRHGAMRAAELASHSKIIHAAERFITPRAATTAVVTASVIRLNFKEPKKPRDTFAPPLKTLPFVKMKGGGRRARSASYWKEPQRVTGARFQARPKLRSCGWLRLMGP
jgi:hypothetical protein